MMALESPLIASPQGLMSAFSPYSDSPGTPNLPKSPRYTGLMASEKRHSQNSQSSTNYESTLKPGPSPIDYDPSPVTSNGTEVTEIDDSPLVETSEPKLPIRASTYHSGSPRPESTVQSIDTTVQNRERSSSEGTPQSVIHAPQGFQEFGSSDEAEQNETGHSETSKAGEEGEQRDGHALESPTEKEGNSSPSGRKTPAPSQRSDFPQESHPPARVTIIPTQQNSSDSPVSPPPISTSINPAKFPLENATPRAQTRQEIDLLDEKSRKRPSSSLEDIPEAHDNEPGTDDGYLTANEQDSTIGYHEANDGEVLALKSALNECWTLCNTLAGLSSIHRERIFNFSGTGDKHEHAWKCCWKLCQKLYDSRDDEGDHHVRPTLDLCRDFCQALFDVRQRENEISDSVLRVSFELNNHLYNTHDRNLPEAFRERTLEFYITLCHRLMKQRSGLAEETDSLLRACWSMAEMLFSLRQNKREGRPADEELLGSAVQSCWELCDLFREGWTQVRPDRGTPRPSQTTFTQAVNQIRDTNLPTVNENNLDENERHHEPETPTTIFDDMPVSPDEAPVPNILVLGTDNSRQPDPRWSSASSTLSGYTQSTASNSTATASAEDHKLIRLKVLIVKAAMVSGYQRSTGQSLNTFVKSMSANTFGSQQWQTQLLEHYRRMVLTDSTFRAPANLPSRRATAAEVARAVNWMVGSGQYVWLKDLFRLVFGFRIEEIDARGNVSIQT